MKSKGQRSCDPFLSSSLRHIKPDHKIFSINHINLLRIIEWVIKQLFTKEPSGLLIAKALNSLTK